MKKQKLPLLFLALPGIILIFLFGYLPLFGLVIAFKNVDYSKGIWASDWVGLKNFEFFFKSNDALRVTRNTLVMNALFIVFTLIVSVSVAIMLYYVGRRMLRVTQTVLFLPYLISWVVASYALEAFIDARYGVVNQFLNFLGLKNINFYYLPKWWYLIIVICYIWKSAGYYSILYYTRLLSVDPFLYEAAEIDGASTWQKIRYGILPQLMPNFASTAIYRFDINLRDATVLGLVGAGGIGAPLIFAMSSYRWNEVGAILLGLIVLVLIIEWISARIRVKLARG